MATLSPLLPASNHHQQHLQQQCSSNNSNNHQATINYQTQTSKHQQQAQSHQQIVIINNSNNNSNINNNSSSNINNNINNNMAQLNQPKPRGRRKKIRTEPIRPICPQCDKQFSNQSALTKHKLTHSDERKFACQQCSKAFKRHDHLTGHMQTHSNRKPFNCNFPGCDKTYCDARSLRRHKENIHGQLIMSSTSTSTSLSSSSATTTITSSSNSSSTTTLASSSSSLSTQLEFDQNNNRMNANQLHNHHHNHHHGYRPNHQITSAISNPNLNLKTPSSATATTVLTSPIASSLHANSTKELSCGTHCSPINQNSIHDNHQHQNYINNNNNPHINNHLNNHHYQASYSADYVMSTQRFTFDEHDLMMAQSTANHQQPNQPGQYSTNTNQTHQQNTPCDIKPNINNNNNNSFFSPTQGPASAGPSSLTNLDPQLQNAVSAISLNVNHEQQQHPNTPFSAGPMLTQKQQHQQNQGSTLINQSPSENYFKNEINNNNTINNNNNNNNINTDDRAENNNNNNNNYAYQLQQHENEKTSSTFSLQSNIQSQLIQRRSHKQNNQARFPGPIITTNLVHHQHPHTVGYEYSRPTSMYTPLEPNLHDHNQNNHHHHYHAPYTVDYINQQQFNFDQNSIMSQSRLHSDGQYTSHYPQNQQHNHSSNDKLMHNQNFLSPPDKNTATSSLAHSEPQLQANDSTLTLNINYNEQQHPPGPLSNDPMLSQHQQQPQDTTLINNSSDCYFKNDMNNNNNNLNNTNTYTYENEEKTNLTSLLQSNDQSQLLQRRSHKQTNIVNLPGPIETTDLVFQDHQQLQPMQANIDNRSSIMYTPLEPNLHDNHQANNQNQFYSEDQHSGTPYSDYKGQAFTFDQIQ